MNILLGLLCVGVTTFVLNIMLIWSNNIVFMLFKKPNYWILFTTSLSFLVIYLGSIWRVSYDVVFWSIIFSFLLNLPPRKSASVKIEIDRMYQDCGISNGRMIYKLGLVMYLFGGLIGTVLFYSTIIYVQ